MAWNRACALSIAPEHDPGDRMLEFHRDQQCHDHAEDRLEHCMIQRVERPDRSSTATARISCHSDTTMITDTTTLRMWPRFARSAHRSSGGATAADTLRYPREPHWFACSWSVPRGGRSRGACPGAKPRGRPDEIERLGLVTNP